MESSHQNRQPCLAQAGRGCRELLGTIRPPEGASASSPRAMASTQPGRKGGRPPRGGGPRLGRSLRTSAHCVPALPFSSARGPHPDLCLQGDLDARAESEGVLSSTRSSPPQTRSEPEACGEARAGFSERDARRRRPGVSPQAGAALQHPAAS